MSNKNKHNKQCTSCLDYLPLENFYRSTNGLYAKCKPCIIAYNTERKKGERIYPRRKAPLIEVNSKKIALRGDKKSCLWESRNQNTRLRGSILISPWGMILDGELIHDLHDDEDVLYLLSNMNIRILDMIDSNLSDEDVRGKVLSLRNSRREPISALRIRGLVSRPQYYLWMDSPRKLLISEVADLLALPVEIVEFIVRPEKNDQGTLFGPPPKNIKNQDQQTTQVYEFTEE